MNNPHLADLAEKYEREVNALITDRPYCLKIYEYMRQHLKSCLDTQNYTALFKLAPYFDNPEDYPHFHVSAETRKIHIMLNFLRLELKYDKEPFISSVSDFSSFIQQYTLTVFALRRLEMELNPESMQEAISYLVSIPLNIYAAKIITENEYFENYNRLYTNLYQSMDTIWSTEDKILWLHFLLEKKTSDATLLELSSLYMDIQDFNTACDMLMQIKAPSSETLSLISLLKEALHNESK